MGAKVERLCIRCGEVVDSRSSKAEMCKVCMDVLKTEAVPEPKDMGEWLCWHDNEEKKIHHCLSRRKVAARCASEKKPMSMPQCGICGKYKKTTPKPPLMFVSPSKQRSLDKAKLRATSLKEEEKAKEHQKRYLNKKAKELSGAPKVKPTKKDIKECQNAEVRPVI